MKKILAALLIVLLITEILISCKQYRTTLTDIFIKPTDKELYLRYFESDSVFMANWNKAFQKAKQDTLNIVLPYQEQIRITDSTFMAINYSLKIEEGTTLQLHVLPKGSTSKIFYSIYKTENLDNPIKEGSFDRELNTITITDSGAFKIVLQPALTSEIQFNLTLQLQSNYKFPVTNVGNKAIQSFWGAPRDGGKRRHQGVDIFAKRGTPVIAVTNGYISYTGEKGLGGKQVWLRDGILGNSLYYAHLDSINSAIGYRVKQGDTLGFVGNTGNARTTAPHLHFGIYKGRQGAINPLEFIKVREPLLTESEHSIAINHVIKGIANLRNGPDTSYPKKITLTKNDTIKVIGKSNNWFRVVYNDSISGFIHTSLIK